MAGIQKMGAQTKIDIDGYYIRQVKSFGIGNFINCTPTIRHLSKVYQKKISVYFELSVVRKMYMNCPFIEVLFEEKDIEDREILFSSQMTNQYKPDWQFIFENICKKLELRPAAIPHTYVDAYNFDSDQPYVVVARGMVSNYWLKKKDPGDSIYRYMLEKIESLGYKIIFIGADADRKRNISRMEKWVKNKEMVIGNVRKSLGVINNAQFMISNDTGMYHAAGAMNQHVFVMWKNTNFKKNKSPGKNCHFSQNGLWQKDFDRWIKDVSVKK